ncbi:MAG: cation:proton antiporter [Bacteroidota bacterium]
MEFSILNLLLVLVVAWLAGIVSARLGYPSVLGELLAGILLGPPLLGLLEPSAALEVLAEVGILLMMLYIGMEIDPGELGKASKGGFLAAIGGFITPFVLCYGAIIWAGGTVMAAIFVGLAAGVTSLATKSRILVDLQLLDTRIAHVLMAGALIADTLSLVLFAAVLGAAEVGSVDVLSLGIVAIKALAFFVVAGLVGHYGFPMLGRALRKLPQHGRTTTFMLILVLTFGYAELAHLAGMHGILGAFLAGLFLRENALGRTLSEEIMHLVRDASIGFLAPVFFVTAGFAVSLDVFRADLGLLVGVIGLATVGKIAGTALFYLPTGYGWREGLTIGAGMNGRGAVEIILAQIALSMGLISQEIFSILVFMAIITTATVPVFLKWGVDWLRERGELVRSDHERTGTIIVGGGPTALRLGEFLHGKHAVTIIDRNADHIAQAEAAGLRAVQGNALDELVLSEAGASTCYSLVAMTANAQVNALVAERARQTFYIPRLHLLDQGSDADGHAALTEHLGASTLFGGPVDLSAWDYHLAHAPSHTTTVAVEEGVPPDITADDQRLPLGLERGDLASAFHSDLTLQPGDVVHLLTATPDGVDAEQRVPSSASA